MALVPEQLTFGGMGVRVGAYLLDELVVRLVAVLIAIIGRSDWIDRAITFVAFPVYFAFWEGPGAGRSASGCSDCGCADRGRCAGPAGAALRARCVRSARHPARGVGGWPRPRTRRAGLSLLPLLVGLVIVGFLMRRSNDSPGLHETVSGRGCCGCRSSPAAETGRPARGPAGRGPAAAGRVPGDGRPVRGRPRGPDRRPWIAIGDDQVLGRRVLAAVPRPRQPAGAARRRAAGRLWPLGHGTATVGGVSYRWRRTWPRRGRDRGRRRPRAPGAVARGPAGPRTARGGIGHEAQKDGSLPGQPLLEQVWCSRTAGRSSSTSRPARRPD